MLEAVHANDSSKVIATIAVLLDAGNGPSQLARQFVRFLRNCVVAKITGLAPETPATGIAADLLQNYRPKKRGPRRAFPPRAMFTEKRRPGALPLDHAARTFDELGYRQEQRFHLELGLLKLVHVQRLVPIEELLRSLKHYLRFGKRTHIIDISHIAEQKSLVDRPLRVHRKNQRARQFHIMQLSASIRLRPTAPAKILRARRPPPHSRQLPRARSRLRRSPR